jgi:hypothetical protein
MSIRAPAHHRDPRFIRVAEFQVTSEQFSCSFYRKLIIPGSYSAPWEQIDAKPRLWHHGQVLDRVARCGPQYAARYMRSRSFWMLREKRPSISRCRATHYSAFQPRLDQSDASAGDSGGNFWQRSRRCHQPSRLISSVAKPLRGKVAQGFSSTSSLTRRTKWRRTSNSG